MYLAGALTRGGSNPIIRNSTSAGQYDSTKVGPHPIVKVAPGDYRMWYEAIKDDANQTTTIAYATSPDGTTWTKYGSNPIVTPAGWENLEVSPNTVFYDGVDGVWKMWYHGGVTNGVGTRKIGYATSSDGITWSKSGSNPILTVGTAGQWDETGVVEPKVIKFGASDYRMWYRGFNASNVMAIGYATSADGVSWTKFGSNPVFQVGAAGQWDDAVMFGFAPVYVDGVFHAWYIAGDATAGWVDKIGYASSPNGTTWTRGPYNPILADVAGEDVTDTVHAYLENKRVRISYGQYDLGASPALRGIGEAYFDGLDEPQGVVIDDFNRADTGPPPSANWSLGVIGYTGGDGLVVSSNQVTRAAAGSFRQGGYWNAQDFGPDLWLIADISTFSAPSGFPGFTMYARLKELAAGTVDGYYLEYDQSFALLTLSRLTNGAGTTIATDVSSFTPAAGDKMALGCFGSTISSWWKPSGQIWRMLQTATDTTYPAAGKVGLELNDGQIIKLDNLTTGTTISVRQLRPDADTTTTGWTTTPLWEKVDEVSAAGDVITATAV